jgi:hypothetical protein
MNFLGLKTAVNSSVSGRTDIPDHIYEVTLAEFNRDIRTVDMFETASITADAEYEALPADFLEAVSLHLVNNGNRQRLQVMTPDELNYQRPVSGTPRRYAVTADGLKLFPTPDAEYTLTLEYYEKIAALSGDSDTNVILSRYPELYLYTALKHVGIWARDERMVALYGPLAEQQKMAVMKSERSRRNSGPWRSRSAIVMAVR